MKEACLHTHTKGSIQLLLFCEYQLTPRKLITIFSLELVGSGARKEIQNNFIPKETTILTGNYLPYAQNCARTQYVLTKLDSLVKPYCSFLLRLGTEVSLFGENDSMSKGMQKHPSNLRKINMQVVRLCDSQFLALSLPPMQKKGEKMS